MHMRARAHAHGLYIAIASSIASLWLDPDMHARACMIVIYIDAYACMHVDIAIDGSRDRVYIATIRTRTHIYTCPKFRIYRDRHN